MHIGAYMHVKDEDWVAELPCTVQRFSLAGPNCGRLHLPVCVALELFEIHLSLDQPLTTYNTIATLRTLKWREWGEAFDHTNWTVAKTRNELDS